MFIELEIVIVDSLDASSGFIPFILSRANRTLLFERDSSLRIQVPRTIQVAIYRLLIYPWSGRNSHSTYPFDKAKETSRGNPCVQAWRIHRELHVATIRIRPLAIKIARSAWNSVKSPVSRKYWCKAVIARELSLYCDRSIAQRWANTHRCANTDFQRVYRPRINPIMERHVINPTRLRSFVRVGE